MKNKGSYRIIPFCTNQQMVAASTSAGREQLHFDDYLDRRSRDENYTFRQHLRSIKGAIEE